MGGVRLEEIWGVRAVGRQVSREGEGMPSACCLCRQRSREGMGDAAWGGLAAAQAEGGCKCRGIALPRCSNVSPASGACPSAAESAAGRWCMLRNGTNVL